MHLDALPARTLLAAARRDGDDAELRCRALLAQAASERDLQSAFQCELARGGLTASGFAVAAALFAHEPAAVLRADLPTATGLSTMRADDALARLEMSQLVRRERDPQDRRLIWLRLTPAGRERIAGAIDRCVAAARRATAGLSTAELTASLAVSGKLRAGAAHLSQPPAKPDRS
jgi:DNA-binding MarR family transcriptional regulator